MSGSFSSTQFSFSLSLKISLMIRAAVCVPRVRVADPPPMPPRPSPWPGVRMLRGAVVALFPELGLSAYSNDDLFHQQALLDASLAALPRWSTPAAALRPLLAVGVPLRLDGRLFNCAVAVQAGRVLA
jgi:NAD+ synthase (glutamine-hydrolysing)